MPVYVITGKLGGGKSLVSVKRIRDYLDRKSIVATNLDLNLEHLISPFDRTCKVIRIPDKPSLFDLECIGSGNESYDEEKNGALVLDECGTWFNARNWNDKARKPVNDWFLHARKLGWDVFLIIQDVSLLDSQARASIAEHTVFCKRTDRLAIPFVSTAYKLITGSKLKLPKYHLGRVVYGISENDMLVDRWGIGGTALYAAYDTKQLFLDDYADGSYSLLPPWHHHGKFMAPRGWEFTMRLTKIYLKRFKVPVVLGAGMLIGSSMAVAAVFATQYDPNANAIAQTSAVAAAEALAKVESFVEDSVITRVREMYITSSLSYGDVVSYGLTKRAGEVHSDFASAGTQQAPPEENSLYTRTLERMGYHVNPISNCSFILSKNNQSVTVGCF